MEPLILHLLMIAYAVCSALHESSVVRGARAYWPVNNPYEKPFHKWGAAMTVIFSLSLIHYGWQYPLLSLLWYWLLFDIVLNKRTSKRWDYVGETAFIDRLLHRLPGNPALIKSILCALAILVIHHQISL